MGRAAPLPELFASMLRIRRVEEAIAARYPEGEMRCPVHFAIGQEAVPAAICLQLARTDCVFSGHRSHGHYLAKGGDLGAMLAELYGRETGCARGRGGSRAFFWPAARLLRAFFVPGTAFAKPVQFRPWRYAAPAAAHHGHTLPHIPAYARHRDTGCRRCVGGLCA